MFAALPFVSPDQLAIVAGVVGLVGVIAMWDRVQLALQRHQLRRSEGARLLRDLDPLGYSRTSDDAVEGTAGGHPVRVEVHGDGVRIMVSDVPPGVAFAPAQGDESGLVFGDLVFSGTVDGLARMTLEVREALLTLKDVGPRHAADGTLWFELGQLDVEGVRHGISDAVRLVDRLIGQEPDLPAVMGSVDDIRAGGVLDWAVRHGEDAAERVARATPKDARGRYPNVDFALHARDAPELLRAIAVRSSQQAAAVRALRADDLPDAMPVVLRAGQADVWTEALLRLEDGGRAMVRALAPLLDRHEAIENPVLPVEELLRRARLFSEGFTNPRVRPWLGAARQASRLEAVRFLETHGELEDVASLREREATARPDIREAIGRAIASIQERAGGQAGAVSLAENRGGHLAVPRIAAEPKRRTE